MGVNSCDTVFTTAAIIELNNRVNLILQSRKVLGSELDGAKFGSAIADMGDLDGDGYRDVAIGAPWENEGRGAVYIYRGGRKGINPDYIQKILAENVDNFGYAIAKGYDVDDNKCNDLAIGAINSDKVYLYRCIPSMEVNAKINKENIIFNIATFDVLFCVHARELPESPDVKITLKGQIVLDRRERRASISDDGVYDVTITPGEKICQNRTVNFKPTAELSRPIKIAFKLMALEVPELKSTHFSKHLARLSPKSKLFDYIGVQINQTAKQLLEMTLKPLNSTFVPGTDTSLGFEITVSNKGEPAYGAKVYTRLPISPNKIPDTCALEDMELTCDIPEPLPSHESVSWKIELEFTQSNYTHDDDIIIAAKLIDFLSSINGSGDSTKEVIIAIRPKATFEITGIAQPNGSIAVSREALSKDESVVFEHYFTITNLGPSDWLKIPVRILIPEKVDLSNTIDGCSEDGDDLNCLWSLKSNDSQLFSLSFKFDLSSHGDYLDEITTFNATSAVMLLRNPNKMVYVTTTLVLDAKTPIWPLIVGIVVGLLTLLAASFGLYKLNFFKRTKREELKKLQEEPTRSDCAANQCPDDNNDEDKIETSAEYLNFE